jgi:site-specific DNA-methyltransferase (adenine-specific)
VLFGVDCMRGMKRLPDGLVNLVVTDPPYGIGYLSGKQTCNTRGGKSKGAKYFGRIESDLGLPVDWLREAHRVMKNDSAMYVFAHWKTFGALMASALQAGFVAKNMLVLVKSNHGMGDLKGAYAPKHELVLYAVKGKSWLRAGTRPCDVFDVKVKYSGARRLHPAEKPVDWYKRLIEASSDVGDLVLDPFAGSGTCGVACIELQREFIGFEIDAAYIIAAQRRLEEAAGAIQR